MSEQHGGLILPPSTLCAGRCALCWESFQLGEDYTTVWPRAGIRLALTLHPTCRAQLVPGDLGRLFGALERRAALPLAVLGLRGWGRHGLCLAGAVGSAPRGARMAIL